MPFRFNRRFCKAVKREQFLILLDCVVASFALALSIAIEEGLCTISLPSPVDWRIGMLNVIPQHLMALLGSLPIS